MEMISPGVIFESLGFLYVGPLNGYDFPTLVETFQNIKQMHRPVLVHVRTVKGKGYGPAEADPLRFHGPSPFDVETGEALPAKKPAPPSFTAVFSDALCELAAQNDKIYAVTPAMASGGGLKKFGEKFPERYHDVGIAEMTAVLMCAGLATEGFIPICSIYSTFLQRAYDQLIHDVGIHDLPVVFVLDRGGIVGADGPTHHGVFDFSYMRCIPNFIIMAPKDENELRHMLYTAIHSKHPIAFRYPRGNALGVPLDKEFKLLEIGKGELLVDPQDPEVVIFTIGDPVYPCVQVADRLEKDFGIRASVVNARFVKPIDEELILRMARRCPNLVTVEENVAMGGFGAAVLECLADHEMTGVRVKRIACPDKFIEHGGQPELRRDHGLDQEGILKTILKFLDHSPEKKEKPRPLSQPSAQV
jgi:1-deoxy-D-xylulose-5-phosphate synthase